MKALIRNLLFSFVFLLSGYSFQYIHAHQNHVGLLPVKALKNLSHIDFKGFRKGQNDFIPVIASVSSANEKENDEQNALFLDDDDELISFRKHLEGCNYPTSVFFTQIQGYFFDNSETILPFYNNFFSYSSSNRCIAFQTLRV